MWGSKRPIQGFDLLVFPGGWRGGWAGWTVMVWSLLYSLTRNMLGATLLGICEDAAKDIEILVLRHQLAVLRHQVNRPALQPADRVLLATLSQLLLAGLLELFVVTPATLLR